MPAAVKHPMLAMVGLAVIALLCVQLLRGAITLEVAAQRALLLVVVLAVVDRIAVPVARAMLAAGRSAGADPEPGATPDRELDDADGRVA